MTAFLITIDTEGDNIWSAPAKVATENARFLPRFQSLCERYGFKPTWLTNYEMAMCPDFVAFARDATHRGQAEVGMHLHAWNSPPLVPLTANDHRYQPYLIEYPLEVLTDKVDFMTDLLTTIFGPVVSHRAGRWAFDERYARVLADRGYTVDCSVTPHVNWSHSGGDPTKQGGTDFSAFPNRAYFIDLDDIKRPGASSLLELPMTIEDNSPRSVRPMIRAMATLPARFARKVWPISWLRPNGRNLASMKAMVDGAHARGEAYVEFMLHSSELMPGGSPNFLTPASIESLYDQLDSLFSYMADRFSGMTLAEFRRTVSPI
jgi:hypothetical protein